jgi:hypothetical protein
MAPNRLTIRIKRLVVADAQGTLGVLLLGLTSGIGVAGITVWLWRGYVLIF